MKFQIFALVLLPLLALAAKPDSNTITTCSELTEGVKITKENVRAMRHNNYGYSWVPGVAETFFIMNIENEKCRDTNSEVSLAIEGTERSCLPFHNLCERDCQAGYRLVDKNSGQVIKDYSIGRYGIDAFDLCSANLK